MTLGVILLDWDSSRGPIMKAEYTEKELDFDIEYLNIFLLHTATGWTEDKAQKEVFTQYEKYNLVSHYIPIIENDILRRIIFGVILETHEIKPDKYYKILEQTAKNRIIFSDDEEKIRLFLKDLYHSKIKNVSHTFTISEVKKMIPLKTSMFGKSISSKIFEIYENFGAWALVFLDQLPQNLEVEKLEKIFQEKGEAIPKLIIWAASNKILRLVS